MYDMIMTYGTEEYVDFKKPITHYKFFDDEQGGGKDSIFEIVSCEVVVNLSLTLQCLHFWRENLRVCEYPSIHGNVAHDAESQKGECSVIESYFIARRNLIHSEHYNLIKRRYYLNICQSSSERKSKLEVTPLRLALLLRKIERNM